MLFGITTNQNGQMRLVGYLRLYFRPYFVQFQYNYISNIPLIGNSHIGPNSSHYNIMTVSDSLQLQEDMNLLYEYPKMATLANVILLALDMNLVNV